MTREQFLSQYTGEWSPSDGHWFGLDFCWRGQEYRFQTDSMYHPANTVLPDGREARFGVCADWRIRHAAGSAGAVPHLGNAFGRHSRR